MSQIDRALAELAKMADEGVDFEAEFVKQLAELEEMSLPADVRAARDSDGKVLP